MISLQQKGLEKTASERIVNSIRQSTQKQYAVYIKKFIEYYDSSISLVTETTVLNFLSQLYENGAKYSVINGAFSAVKTYLELMGVSITTGLITRFKKGVFNERPSLPRLTVVWDPQIVLDYYTKHKSNAELAFVTTKCVTLLALASSQRVSTLHSLKLSDVMFADTGTDLTITISELQKQSRPGYHLPPLQFSIFEPQELCIVRTLKQYIEIIEPLRVINPLLTSLFVTHGKPYRNASKDTISRWIKDSIHKAGVPSCFTAHSTRAASVSSMMGRGIDISSILKKAGWSNQNVLHKFYNKAITK